MKICNSCGAENFRNSKYCTSCGYAMPLETPSTSVAEKSVQPKKGSRPGKKSILTVALSILGAVGGSLLVKFLFLNSPNVNPILAHTAGEINKSCPLQLDAETRLDNAVALPGKILAYNYTLINYTLDAIEKDSLEAYLRPRITNLVSTSPDMATLREYNVVFNYNYRDRDGRHILKIEIGPDVYN